MKDYQIIKKNVAELIPYEYNPRKNDQAVQFVANSLKVFGFINPIVIDENNVIVCGHTRYKAALINGYSEVPCICVDDLTPEQIRAFRLVDNKTAEISSWDEALEIAEMSALDGDFDWTDFGWSLEDFDDIDLDRPIQEDDVPDVDENAETTVKLGDLWQLGKHRLICGDCTDKAVIDRLMNGKRANMVFTDPPYGYSYQSNWRDQVGKFDIIANDDKILDFFPSIVNICDGFVYVCTTWKTADKWTELFKKYYELTNVIIWDKGGGGIGDLFHTFSTDYEMILVCNNKHEIKGMRYGSVWSFTDDEVMKMKKEDLLRIVLEQKQYCSIWRENRDNPNEYVHPTQKPIALSARAIRSSTDFGENVLDLFGGSGSTLMACEQLNRNCFMSELDPHYCDVIIQRWENFTGEKAVLIK